MTQRTIGIDEAGRGPILGPMALAVVAVDEAGAAELVRLGVQDSKKFGSDARARRLRAELADIIPTLADVRCVLVTVDVIDHHTFQGRLNHLERAVAAELLAALAAAPHDLIIADGANLFRPLRATYPALQPLDRGEAAHPAVAAASILAKHARDEAFAHIVARYEPDFGPITGGGYINPATRRFLDAYQARHGCLPPEARRSWGAPRDPDPQLTLHPQT